MKNARIILLLYLSLVAPAAITSEVQPKTANILLLTSGRPSAPWVVEFESSFANYLKELPYPTNLSREYLESWASEETQFQETADFIIKKYSGKQIDYIVTTGFVASSFLNQIEETFSSAKKIGINVLDSEMHLYDRIIGSKYDLANVFGEIKRLVNPSRIIIIGDDHKPSLAANLDNVIEAVIVEGLSYELVLNQTLAEFQSSVAEIDSGKAVFFFPITRVVNGKKLYPQEVLQRISAHSAVPVFSDSESMVGKGSVGGLVSSAERAARAAVLYITRPEKEIEVFHYVYDWKELRRWGLAGKIHVPAQIVNKPIIIYFTVGAGLLLVISGCVFVFLRNSIKKREHNSPFNKLSRRELEILAKIAEGKAIKEIAYDMQLSDRTVSTYKKRVMNKLGLSDSIELTRLLIEYQKYLP